MSWMDDAPKVPVYVKTTQKAAKDYPPCPYCKQPILKGQTYERTFMIEDGQPQVSRTHLISECSAKDGY